MTEQRADYITEARGLIGWDRPIEIQDDGDLRKYRIELPNLYDDSDLDPYEFRLLAHYKRVGNCTEGSKTTGRICRMSSSQVSVKRMALRKKGFIRMQRVQLPDNQYSYRITVIDRWLENFKKYSKSVPPSPPDTPPSPPALKNTTISKDSKNIFALYEGNIGALTSIMADTLQAAEKDYPAEWIVDAITLAVTNNKRNWKYCEAILKRWETDGKDSGKKEQAPVEMTRML